MKKINFKHMSWLPFTIAIIIFGIVVFLHSNLKANINERRVEVNMSNLNIVSQEVRDWIHMRIHSLQHISSRFSLVSQNPIDLWKADSQLFLTKEPAFTQISLIDTQQNILANISSPVHPTVNNVDNFIREICQNVSQSMSAEIHTLPTTDEVTQYGIICTPVIKNSKIYGFMVSTIDFNLLIGPILNLERIAPGYAIDIMHNHSLVYHRPILTSLSDNKWEVSDSLILPGSEWNISVKPTAKKHHEMDSHVPTTILMSGALFSVLISFLIHMWQDAHVKAEKLELSNEKLTSSEERYRRLSEASFEGIVITDDGLIINANSQFCDMFGLDENSIVGQDIFSYASNDSKNILLKKMNDADEKSFEFEGLHNSGHFIPIEAHSKIFTYHDKRLRITAFHDLSERKHLENQLRHSQKMEAIGRLVGGLAHDFNNMLMIIIGYSQLLAEQLKKDQQRLTKQVNAILGAGHQASSLVKQLLAFGRKQVLNEENINFNDILDETQNMLPHVMRENTEVVVDKGHNLLHVEVDNNQMQQVLLNLCINARDAMPRGGTLTLKTDMIHYKNFEAGLVEGQYIHIQVKDTGIGMPDEIVQCVFEPFFTTKEIGKGTGLGLSMVHGIITQSHGHIEVESREGFGTTFHIYLPAHEISDHIEKEPVSTVDKNLKGKGQILLVEDNIHVIDYVQEVLEVHGYNVLSAITPQIAMQLFDEHKDKIDLLLTDMIMPQFSGKELAKILISRHSNLKVIYMSGYVNEGNNVTLNDNEVDFIWKPCQAETLLKKVKKALCSKHTGTEYQTTPI